MRALVLGAGGMLGHAVLRYLARSDEFDAWGTARSDSALHYLDSSIVRRIDVGIDVLQDDALCDAFDRRRPELVVNAIGVVKQVASGSDPLTVMPINSLLPHRVARLCRSVGARLIHVSTDCVFSGEKGGYTEDDIPDARDLYGRSKLLGEIDQQSAITLRTSIIGHELGTAHGLVEWFLRQHGACKGFANAVFSGLPTVTLAALMMEIALKHQRLCGLYHVSADPIDKYSLLKLVAQYYGKTIEIERDESITIDRSLDSSRFRCATGWTPESWPSLVQRMREFH